MPGIRENGGQYTHAAAWLVLAEALMGRGRRAAELLDLLNPIRHADTPEAVARYRVEPYVVAGDVYGRPPHTGRGGWTWYTGSASWLYRVALESILGLRTRRRPPRHRPVHPRCLAAVRGRLPISDRFVPDRGREPRRRRAGRPFCPPGRTAVAGDGVALADDARTYDVVVVLGGASNSA